MATTDEYEGEYQSSDVAAWRVGDWIYVQLGERIVLRRLTSDRAFQTARVRFSSNRSPRYPRTDHFFQGADVLTRPPRGSASNSPWKEDSVIEVPIVEERVG